MAASVLFQFFKFNLVTSGVLIANFEQVSHVATVLLLLNLNESMSTIFKNCTQKFPEIILKNGILRGQNFVYN